MDIPTRKKLFIAALKEWGTFAKASEASGVPRRTIRRYRDEDLEFAEAVADAVEEYGDELQQIMFDRIKNPSKGIGTDTLLIFALQGAKPETYRPQIMVEQDTARRLMSEWFKTRQEEKRQDHVEESEELSEPIERTLEEALRKRAGSGSAVSVEEEEAAEETTES